MSSDKSKMKGFLIDTNTANLLIAMPDEKIAAFFRDYAAYNLYGIMPRVYGSKSDGMDSNDELLVSAMKMAIDYSKENAEKYEEKCRQNRENGKKGGMKSASIRAKVDVEQVDSNYEPAKPEPAPAPKKRTYARRNSKNEEKKELTPEEIEIKEKNDKGEEIFFEAWERYDPTYKGISYKDIIERDASGHNKLLEKIVDIGRDDLLNAVDAYKADRDAKGLIKKGSKNFFGDMEFLSYIGKPAVVSNKRDDDFDEFNEV